MIVYRRVMRERLAKLLALLTQQAVSVIPEVAPQATVAPSN